METRRRKTDLNQTGVTTNDRIRQIVFGATTTEEESLRSLLNESNKRSKLDPESAMRTDDFGDDNGDDDYDNYDSQMDLSDVYANSPPIDTIKFCTDPNWLTELLDKEAENQILIPRDHGVLFDKNCSLGSTKRAFCIDMQNAVAQNGMSFTQLNDVFEVLQRHTSSLKLPIIKPNPLNSVKHSNTGVKNNIHKYVGQDHRTCVIDVCQNDCVAFHGDKEIDGTKFSEMIYCPVCPSKRFSHCSHPDCKDKEYSECNPFKRDPNTGKPLNTHKRSAEKTLYYRPITAKLLHLYKLSLLEGNDGLLRYFQERYRVTRPGKQIKYLMFSFF
jgi:hypothetical protein